MAEGFINFTEGSGKKLRTFNRTIGANSIEEQFVNLGEPSNAGYVAIGSAVAFTTANSHMLQLMAGSSLNVRIRRIRITQQAAPAAVTAQTIQIWRLTSAGTGGGAVTPSKKDNGDAAAGATAMTLPTAKGTEGVQLWDETMWMGSAAIPITRVWEWVQLPNAKPFIIPAGTTNGIAIKNTTGTATASAAITIEFDETSYL